MAQGGSCLTLLGLSTRPLPSLGIPPLLVFPEASRGAMPRWTSPLSVKFCSYQDSPPTVLTNPEATFRPWPRTWPCPTVLCERTARTPEGWPLLAALCPRPSVSEIVVCEYISWSRIDQALLLSLLEVGAGKLVRTSET